MAITLMVIVGGAAIPLAHTSVDRSRAVGAASYVAGRMASARFEAVRRSAHVAIRFIAQPDGYWLQSYVDGNRNGVLTRDIDDGTDPPLTPPVQLEALFPGVTVSGEGGPRLFSFSPDGTATTGSIYLESRDGSHFAVRILGATARVRIERYVTARAVWVELF